MRYFILLLIAAIGGYGVMQIDRIDPDNYVKMYLGNYVVEVRVLGLLLLITALVIALSILIWLLRLLWKTPSFYANWRLKKKIKSADEALGSGYLSLIKGDWQRAEKQLTSQSQHSKLPYINYLAAAQAAQEQGRLVQRDDYLNAAYKAAPEERLAIGLTKARLHQSAGQLEQALATLEDVGKVGQKNPQFTAMLMQAYEQLGNWEGALALLPTAKKQQALSIDTLEKLNDRIYTARLKTAHDMEEAWKALPRDQKKNTDNVFTYASYLLANNENSAAEKLLRTTLKSKWSEPLVRLYGGIVTDKPAKLRRTVEGWLMARPENAELNLAAGRFAIAEKNYDLAKQYLQASVAHGQLPKAYSLLGEVFETSGDSGKALQLYRAGMVALSKVAETKAQPESQVLAELEGDQLPNKPSVKEGDLMVKP